MTDSPTGRLAQRAGQLNRWVKRRLRRSADGGFVLLESIIAISLIAVIMTALGVLFLNTIASADQGRDRSAAIQVANSTLENLRSQDATSLVSGRDAASVTTEFAASQATTTPVKPWLASMDAASDSTATSGGATAVIPTVGKAQVQGHVTYTVTQYLGWCYIATSGTNTDCVKASLLPTGVTSVQYLRAVIAVSWTGPHCNTTSCTYVTSTLVSTKSDPLFPNETLPAVPIVTNPGAQVNAVNDTVSLQLTVQNGTGVPTFTWNATGLPTNLSINPAGLISGTPTVQTASPVTVTVTVTDAYGRTAAASFKWTIEPALVIAAVAPQASLTGSTVSLTLTASGGDGAPFTWSDPKTTLPTGLSISSAGKITGTPTLAGVYAVSVTVADKSTTRTATQTFVWTVTYPPIAASNPGTQTDTLNATIAPLQLSASGGSGNYVWSATGLPAGLSISATGKITGKPTAIGTSTVSVTVSDPTAGPGFTQTVGFSWSVVAAPTIGGTSTQTTTEGDDVSTTIAYTCPDGPCTINLTGSVPGIGLSTTANRTGNIGTVTLSVTGSGSIYLTGTVQSTAVTTGTSKAYTPSVTITDSDSAVGTSTAGTWTVFTAPTLGALATNKVTETDVISVAVTYTCPNVSCEIDLSNSVPGIGLTTNSALTGNNTTTALTVSSASGTVYLAGTVQNTAVTTGTSKAYSPSLTITDSAGVSSAASTATWTAYVVPTITALTTSTTTITATKNVALAYTCPATSCTIALSGGVPGLGLSATTGKTGNNTTTSLTVSAASGTVYIGGTTQTGAVPTGTSRAWNLDLSITDTTGFSPADSLATWTAYGGPNITGLAALSKARGTAVSQTLSYTCPVASCTIAVTGAPSGIGVDTDTTGTAPASIAVTSASGTAYIRGTISSTATRQTYTVKITITDVNGVVSTITASWTVS